MVPAELKYTREHEWCAVVDGRIRVGITDYAQSALGDIVFVQLPAVGETLAAGEAFGEVESTKSVSDLYAPIGGKVAAVNEALDASPELINSAPFGEGWIIEIEVGDGGSAEAGLASLLDSGAYESLIAES